MEIDNFCSDALMKKFAHVMHSRPANFMQNKLLYVYKSQYSYLMVVMERYNHSVGGLCLPNKLFMHKVTSWYLNLTAIPHNFACMAILETIATAMIIQPMKTNPFALLTQA